MDKKDVCIVCGAESPYYFSTPIYHRHGYIEGAGQGCFVSSDIECDKGKDMRNKSIHLKKT